MRLTFSPSNVAAAVTCLFIMIICLIGVLIFFAAGEMRGQANELDDARAAQAAKAAIDTFESSLGSTVRDNAVWDDAYSQIGGPDGAKWAYENWGKTSQNYSLYDAAIVLAPNQRVVSAYLKGKEFDPVSYFGNSIYRLAQYAVNSGREPMSMFVATKDGPYLLAAGAIQPYTGPSPSPRISLSTLIFAKRITQTVAADIDKSFNIDGLAISARPDPNSLSTPLIGPDGRAVAYFQWPRRLPGNHIYHSVQGYLLAALLLLLVFFLAMALAGKAVVHNLRSQASDAQEKAIRDELTGLLNRTGLLETINSPSPEQPKNSSRSLGLIDLDGFKEVNDAWGHAVGDELIKLVADRLTETLSIGTLARLGGDEFAFLASPDEIAAKASALLTAMRIPFKIDGRTIEVRASVGTVIDKQGDLQGLELLRRADMALYEAKETGRGHVVPYFPKMDLDRVQRAELEEKLRIAIETNGICVAFQPLVDAKTGLLRGVEALARWCRGNGVISPEVFIPAAERAGLIDALGEKILDLAIQEASAWERIGLSVNVSPVQLRNPEFPDRIEKIIAERRFDPARLTLEITEGVLMTNPEQAKRAIARLKSIGIRFALDDFGSGYASIGALREFGFDRMKIDRTMITALEEEKGASLLMATMSLAKALGIPATAEGIETKVQAEKLKAAGCDQLQGYFFGKPMPAKEITPLILTTTV